MSKKFRLLMALVLVTGLLGGLMTSSTVSADPIVGTRIQIPRIDMHDLLFPGNYWLTRLQIQNTRATSTWVAVCYWRAYSGMCPDMAPGPLSTWHKQLIPPHGVWTVTPPSDAQSAIVWSLAAEPTSCPGVYSTATKGQPLAVTVDRWGKGINFPPSVELSSSYVGISEEMEGTAPPLGWKYFAPYVMYGYLGALDSVITIQNSGEDCIASIHIYYKEQGNCEYQRVQNIYNLAPGEAVRLGPSYAVPAWADVAFDLPLGGWLGSAYISASEPLGIIVDQLSLDPTGTNRAMLLTYRALPYKQLFQYDWYADLLYREISGWDSSIQVQNLTQVSKPTFVTVDFMDQSGDEILFVGDWVCRNGAVTFYLPAITDLGVNHPFGYVGAAEIASLQQVDYPGGHEYGEPIFAVVDIKKRKIVDPITGLVRPTETGERQGGAYNAHPRVEKEWAWFWYMPFIAMQGNGVTSRIALRNNANCNKFYGKIWVYDETGTAAGVIHTPWLHPKHLKIIDLAYQGFLYPGFVGAAVFEVWSVEQLCDVDNDGHVDNKPIMPSIVVMNYGWQAELGISPPATTAGDLTRIYEAIPGGHGGTCHADLLGKVHSIDPCEDPAIDAAEPIEDVTVTVSGLYADTTNSTGDYEVEDLAYGMELPVSFAKDGFLDYDTSVDVDCGEDEVLDAELLCLGDVTFEVLTSVVTDTLLSIVVGADVDYSKDLPAKAAHYGATYTITGTTDYTGQETLTVPIINASGVFTISAPGVAEDGTFLWDQMQSGTNITATNGRIDDIYFTEESWGDFDEEDCANIGGVYVTLNNTGDALILCGFGTVAGFVEVGGIAADGQLVQVIMDGQVVGEAYTDMRGRYIIEDIATECMSATGCDNFQVLCNGWLQNGTWNGCGDIERVDFDF